MVQGYGFRREIEEGCPIIMDVNEVEQTEDEVKEVGNSVTSPVVSLHNSGVDATLDDDTAITVGAKDPPCTRRIYARRRRTAKPKEETEGERLERIIKQARPPVRPARENDMLDPDDQGCRLKRTLTQLREHCRKRGIKHPLFDKDYNKEVKD